MEDVNTLEPVDVLGVAPIRDVVARPFDEVLELLVPNLGIEHFLHLPFFFSVDFHWWRWGYDLAGVGVIGRWFQFGYVSHGVHLDVSREIHLEGIGGLEVRVFQDLKWAFVFVVECYTPDRRNTFHGITGTATSRILTPRLELLPNHRLDQLGRPQKKSIINSHTLV